MYRSGSRVQDAVDKAQRVMGVHPTTFKTSILTLHALRNTFWIIGAYTDPGGLPVPTRGLSSDPRPCGLRSPRTLEGQTQCTCLLPFPLLLSRQVTWVSLPSFSVPKKMFCGTPTMTGTPPRSGSENHPCFQPPNQGQSHLWSLVTRAGGSAWRCCPMKVQDTFLSLMLA